MDRRLQPEGRQASGVELGGTTPGTQHDQLVVNGTATLGGTLKVSFTGGFTPSLGDTFTILTATSVTGTFAAVEEPNGLSFAVAYNPTSVVLTAQANEAVIATLAPTTGPPDGPVVIPATGGTVRYRATLRNTTGTAQTVQAWIEGLLPNGNVYQGSPLVGPVSQTLNPNQTLGPVSLVQPVPSGIAAGVYAIRLRVGTYPDTVLDEDLFVVQKLAPPARVAGGEALASEALASEVLASEAAGWTVYEVTDGSPVLAAAAMTEAEVAALEAAMRETTEDDLVARRAADRAARDAAEPNPRRAL